MPLTYINPVYPEPFADPFVLPYNGRYFAFGTGVTEDERVLPALVSDNLVDWTPLGGVLVPPDGAVEFWAPEVAEQDGRFYLYYSARGIAGRDHQLRVAISDQPQGPYQDTGRLLVPDQPFTIDAHPFRGPDGSRYLFYARDFLTLDGDFRVGTGIVVDRMLDMLTLAGKPTVVVRPHADWQLFRAGRAMYGAVYDWHTVEGPAALNHDGQVYCFYSGGAWEMESYGVSYVTATDPLGPYIRPAAADARVLKSVVPHIVGPGHNSFVSTPNGQIIMVYHAWDAAHTGRFMRLDALAWQDQRPLVTPTWTPTLF